MCYDSCVGIFFVKTQKYILLCQNSTYLHAINLYVSCTFVDYIVLIERLKCWIWNCCIENLSWASLDRQVCQVSCNFWKTIIAILPHPRLILGQARLRTWENSVTPNFYCTHPIIPLIYKPLISQHPIHRLKRDKIPL